MKIITKLDLYEMIENNFSAGYREDVDIRDVLENVYGETVDNWNAIYGRGNWVVEGEYTLDEEDFLKWWDNL